MRNPSEEANWFKTHFRHNPCTAESYEIVVKRVRNKHVGKHKRLEPKSTSSVPWPMVSRGKIASAKISKEANVCQSNLIENIGRVGRADYARSPDR
jgi:hypothetical protein